MTFCLSALVKWNTQAYLKLLWSFTSHSDIIIKEKEMAWSLEYTEPKSSRTRGIIESVRKNDSSTHRL